MTSSHGTGRASTHMVVRSASRVQLAPHLALDPAAYTLYRPGRPPRVVPPLEWHVLTTLGRQHHHVVDVTTLMSATWPGEVRERADLYTLVWRLRQWVEIDPHDPRLLQTQRGRGYVWEGNWPMMKA